MINPFFPADINGEFIVPGDIVAWKRRRTNEVLMGKVVKITKYVDRMAIGIRPNPTEKDRWPYMVTCYSPTRVGKIVSDSKVNEVTVGKIFDLN